MVKTAKDKDPRTIPREPRKWAVMVYMAAGDSELDPVAVQDLREMERGANGSTHIVVQINRAWPDSFQRYEIRRSKHDARRGESLLIDSDSDATDMGDQETLENFLRWVPTVFPAERYFLVLWGHAFGLGFGRDHNNKLTLKELKTSLEHFRKARTEMLSAYPKLKGGSGGSDGRLEILGTNACAMSYVEAAYELRSSAQLMVASQISVPFAGWPYESILRRIPEAADPADLGRLVVDTYVGFYNSLIRGERVAMSLLDLRKLDKTGPRDLIQRFALAIRDEAFATGRFGGKGKGAVRDVFIGATAGDVRPLIDLQDLCEDFATESEALEKVAHEVRQLFVESVVVHHDRHPDLDALHGIGIYAPFVTDEEDLRRLQLLDPAETGRPNGKQSKSLEKTGREEYQSLSLFGGADAAWPKLVYDDLRQEISPELCTCIAEIDASSRQDRRDVTQIILSIDATFNKLDRVLSSAKQHVNAALTPRNGYHAPLGPPAAPSDRPRRFGLPWLKLIQPIDLEKQLQTLRQQIQLGALQQVSQAPTANLAALADDVTSGKQPAGMLEAAMSTPIPVSPPPSTIGEHDPQLLDTVVDFFARVEKAIGEVERATRRGLTHPTLGIGPAFPASFGQEPPKSGLGQEPPKSGLGQEPPKSGLGRTPFFDERSLTGADLRVDLAVARVAELFRQVGEVLKALEEATLEVESRARAVLTEAELRDLSRRDLLEAAAEDIGRAFGVLEEASTNARRTVRRVLSHPIYGIGPGGGGIGLEERQGLASAGGLEKRNLRLL